MANSYSTSCALDELPPPTSCKFFTNEFQVKYFLPRVDHAKDYGTSWVLCPSPVYIIYRFLWVAFWITVLIYDIVNLDQSGKVSRETFLIYLTNWGYCLILLGSIFRFISSVVYACAQPDGTAARVLYRIDFVLCSLYTPLAIYISLVYWTSLYEGDIDFLDVATHAMNVVYTIVDLFISSFPFRILAFWYAVVFGIAYLLVTVVYWAVADRPVYDIVDWGESPGLGAGLAVGTILAIFLLQMLIFLLFWLRTLIRHKYDCDTVEQKGRNQPV